MFFYGYRYYDPETGRWPSREPIRELAFTLNYAVNYNTTIETIAFWFVSTSSTFVENDSLNYIDLLRLSKGGKQNISVNHNGTNYNKSSDPGDVRNAMNQAKQSGQSKAAKVLKGLLKVIKRGGGWAFFRQPYYHLIQICHSLIRQFPLPVIKWRHVSGSALVQVVTLPLDKLRIISKKHQVLVGSVMIAVLYHNEKIYLDRE